MAQNFFSVTQLNRYIRDVFSDDYLLNDIGILGEISNFKNHPSGHMYFTLKDETAAVSCIMFKNDAYDLNFEPANGMKVIACGRVSVYEKTGQYQLYVNELEQAGIGVLYERFELLKKKLASEGLFDEDRKKPMPRHISHIAVITSKTGAAVRDIIKVVKDRNKSIKITVVPALVQGEDGARDVVRCIKDVNKWGRADAVIIGRGGGSYEDLQVFNEESVARAIADSKIFTVSAVGHETDFTISDFVADMRAATPSAAAEMLSEDAEAARRYVNTLLSGAKRMLISNLEQKKALVQAGTNRQVLKHPLIAINTKRDYVHSLLGSTDLNIRNRISSLKNYSQNTVRLAESLSPLKVLSRGYAVVYKDDEVITTVEKISENDNIRIELNDGEFEACITKNQQRRGREFGEKEIDF